MKRNLKILIVGSCDHPGLSGSAQEKYQRTYRNICEEIARAIVAHGHTIVIGSVRDHTADKYAFDKITGAGQSAHVLMVSDQVHLDKIGELQNGRSIKLRRAATWSWPAGRVTQAALCNAVIAIGGKDNTLSSAYMGLALGKVIMGIPFAGYAGADITNQLMPFYKQAKVDQLMSDITNDWTPTDADKVIKALERLEKLGVFRVRHRPRLAVTTLLISFSVIAASLSFPQSYTNPLFWPYWKCMVAAIALFSTANVMWLQDRFETFGWVSDSLFRTIAASCAVWLIWMAGAELAFIHLTPAQMYSLALSVVALSFFWEQVSGRLGYVVIKLLKFVITHSYIGLRLGPPI